MTLPACSARSITPLLGAADQPLTGTVRRGIVRVCTVGRSLWTTWTSAAFLKSYLAVADAQPFVPREPESTLILLDVCLLEKALYELRYELNNRPTWASIPLHGILQLLDQNGP